MKGRKGCKINIMSFLPRLVSKTHVVNVRMESGSFIGDGNV